MNLEYIKNYKDKELKQYIVASFFLIISFIGLSIDNLHFLESINSLLFNFLTLDLLEGALCILVFTFTELWDNNLKIKLVYKQLPSFSVFSDIVAGNYRTIEFDLESAKIKYKDYSMMSGIQQSIKWNEMLKASRKKETGNVIEAERTQLLTRDMCLSTITMMVANIIIMLVLAVKMSSLCYSIQLFFFPLLYLFVMFFVTKGVARKKANRLVELVIKNDMLSK